MNPKLQKLVGFLWNNYIKPLALASAITVEIPFLFMVLIADAETLRVTHLFSSGIKNFLVWRFG